MASKRTKRKPPARDGQPGYSADGADADDEVGYCKPPKQHRFRPGRSGNPKGRPKQSRNLKSIVEAELLKMIDVREHGRLCKKPRVEVMVAQMTGKALQGDPRAFANVVALAERTGALA